MTFTRYIYQKLSHIYVLYNCNGQVSLNLGISNYTDPLINSINFIIKDNCNISHNKYFQHNKPTHHCPNGNHVKSVYPNFFGCMCIMLWTYRSL